MSQRVIKLGGGTLATPEWMRKTVSQLDFADRPTLVVSAPRGFTNALLRWDEPWLRERCRLFANHLLSPDSADDFLRRAERFFECAAKLSRARRAAQGELWTAQLTAAYLQQRGQPAHAVDARSFLRVGGRIPTIKHTDWFDPTTIAVVTGFIARDANGETVTLGRDGSDFTAALVAQALVADEVHFITDTAGIRSADPGLIAAPTVCLRHLNYAQAQRIAELGGGILHRRTIEPLQQSGLLAKVYQIDDPKAATHIHAAPASCRGLGVFQQAAETGFLPTRNTFAGEQLATALDLPTARIEQTGVRFPAAEIDRVHRELYLSPTTIPLIIIGTGQVGSALIELLADRGLELRAKLGLALEPVAICNSRRLWTHEQPNGAPSSLAAVIAERPNATIVDITADADIARSHVSWLNAGRHVVTANKLALAADNGDELLQHSRYGCQATVGAGLPFIATCRQFVPSGVTALRAVLSGSCNAVLRAVESGRTMAQAISQAQAAGLLEPNPAADLEGLDTARKLTILGRALGQPIRLETIKRTAIGPEQLAAMKLGPDSAAAYVASWSNGHWRVGLQLVNKRGALYVEGEHNALEISAHGKVLASLRGPGAGPTVTADALLRDLVSLHTTTAGSNQRIAA